MRLCVLILLTGVSVWGFPQKRTVEKHSALPQLVQVIQQNKEPKTREAQRDCKGKCATGIAQKAAAEAKAAQAAQNAAGAQAAHMVKTQLAEKALQAAKAAEAALAGKQAVVEQLQQEVKEAEAVVAENTAAVHQQQGTVNAAIQAAQQATAQHKLVLQATQVAEQLYRTSHCVLERAKTGLQERCQSLNKAQARLARVQQKLNCACSDCSATQQAAHSASESARTACGNARKKKSVPQGRSSNQNPLSESEIAGREQ